MKKLILVSLILVVLLSVKPVPSALAEIYPLPTAAYFIRVEMPATGGVPIIYFGIPGNHEYGPNIEYYTGTVWFIDDDIPNNYFSASLHFNTYQIGQYYIEYIGYLPIFGKHCIGITVVSAYLDYLGNHVPVINLPEHVYAGCYLNFLPSLLNDVSGQMSQRQDWSEVYP